MSFSGTPAGPFGFVGAEGYQEDGDSGLKLLGHRYYDPSTARFLTRDPMKDERNWFSYCSGNPATRVDSKEDDWGAVIGGLVGGVVARAIIAALE